MGDLLYYARVNGGGHSGQYGQTVSQGGSFGGISWSHFNEPRGSWSGFQHNGNTGNGQHLDKSNQQHNNQSAFQSNPNQLNNGQYHIFVTNTWKQDQKCKQKAINMVELTVPRYLNWFEQPIIWIKKDHPPQVDNPVALALVVPPHTKHLRPIQQHMGALFPIFHCKGHWPTRSLWRQLEETRIFEEPLHWNKPTKEQANLLTYLLFPCFRSLPWLNSS